MCILARFLYEVEMAYFLSCIPLQDMLICYVIFPDDVVSFLSIVHHDVYRFLPRYVSIIVWHLSIRRFFVHFLRCLVEVFSRYELHQLHQITNSNGLHQLAC